MLIEIFKAEKQSEKRQKMEQNIQELWDNYKRCNIYIIEILEGTEEIFEATVIENFSQINIKHQSTDLGI